MLLKGGENYKNFTLQSSLHEDSDNTKSRQNLPSPSLRAIHNIQSHVINYSWQSTASNPWFNRLFRDPSLHRYQPREFSHIAFPIIPWTAQDINGARCQKQWNAVKHSKFIKRHNFQH